MKYATNRWANMEDVSQMLGFGRPGTADPFVVASARRGDKRVKRKSGPFNKRKPRSTGAQGGRKK